MGGFGRVDGGVLWRKVRFEDVGVERFVEVGERVGEEGDDRGMGDGGDAGYDGLVGLLRWTGVDGGLDAEFRQRARSSC